MGRSMAERREMEMWDAEQALLDAMMEGSDELTELTARYECLKEEHKNCWLWKVGNSRLKGLQGTRSTWCMWQAACFRGG